MEYLFYRIFTTRIVKDRYNYSVIFGKNVTKEIKDGAITVTEEQLEAANNLYNEIESITEACEMPVNSWFEHFCAAWYHVRNNDPLFIRAFKSCSFDTFLKEISRQSQYWGFKSIGKNIWIQRFQTVVAAISDSKVA